MPTSYFRSDETIPLAGGLAAEICIRSFHQLAGHSDQSGAGCGFLATCGWVLVHAWRHPVGGQFRITPRPGRTLDGRPQETLALWYAWGVSPSVIWRACLRLALNRATRSSFVRRSREADNDFT
jgi:hypothetical protein